MFRVFRYVMIPFLFLLSQSVLADNYQKWVDDITQRLNHTEQLLKENKIDDAKTEVQMAYFEIFENLEGPIRINFSAQKSYQMEATFGEIRKMIGATDGSNHQLLLKRFALMGIVALVVSWILDEITFTVLRSMRSLVHIRLLLGRYFYLDSILLAFLSMMLVIFVVLEIQWKVHRMRNEKY